MKRKTLPTGPLRRSNRISGVPPEFMIPTEFKPSKSRLLTLPPEVRNIIWNIVLGDQAIHLCGQFGELVTTVCQSQNSKVCHEMFVNKDPDSKYFGVSSPAAAKYADRTNDACITSHDVCRSGSSLTSFSLNFLRCCRQVYFESKLIPYLSNEFIFENGNAFRLFLREIGPAQMKAVTSITLQLECNDRIHRFSQCGLPRPHIGYWNIVLEPALVQQLVGLQNLQINLRESNEEYESFEDAIKLGPLLIGGALGFGRLPLKTVKIIVTNYRRAPSLWEDSDGVGREFSWSLEARQALAKTISDGLLQQPELHNISKWEKLRSLCKGFDEDDFWRHMCLERRAVPDD